MTNTTPKVSIVCVTYNQEAYISEAIESFLEQQTNFLFEIIIADDASTDSTPSVIMAYAKKYPNVFRPILRKKNIGIQANFLDAMRAAKGEYIALCEGDDFWENPKKLQKQVDFLSKHSDYSVCFHPVRIFYQDSSHLDTTYPTVDMKPFTLKNLVKSNYIQTNSVMYRKTKYEDLPFEILPIDWYLHLLHARNGKIGFINETMAAYRKHNESVWWDSNGNISQIWLKHGIKHLGLYMSMLDLFQDRPQFLETINQHVKNIYNALVETDSKYSSDLVMQAIKTFPEAANIYTRLVHDQIIKMDKASIVKDKTLADQQNEINRLETLIREQAVTINKQQHHIEKFNNLAIVRIGRYAKRLIKR